MNPIIIITLLLLGIGGAYFTMINLGDAQVAAGGVVNPLLAYWNTRLQNSHRCVAVVWPLLHHGCRQKFRAAAQAKIVFAPV